MDKWLNKTYIVQIIAVAIAILLWTVVRINNDSGTLTSPDSLEKVPIQLRIDHAKYTAVFEPQTADVELRGKSADLLKVRMSGYQIIADATRLSAGAHNIQLTGLDFPAGIDVIINPSTVRVELEKLRTKEFPVQVKVSGKPAEGFEQGNRQVKPTRVKITGSAEQLKSVNLVMAEVDLQGSDQNVEAQVEVEILDVNGKLLELPVHPETVLVNIPIIRHVKLLPVKINVEELPPMGYAVNSIVVNPKQVSVFASNTILKGMTTFDSVPLNLSPYTTDQTVELSVQPMENMTSVEPSILDVTVKIVPSEKRKFKNVPLEWNGPASGFVAKTSNELKTMDLWLEGAPAVLNRVASNQLRLVGNLMSLGIGKHPVTLEPVLPEWVRMVGEKPMVEVEIQESNE